MIETKYEIRVPKGAPHSPTSGLLTIIVEETIFAIPPALIEIRGTIYPPFASSAVLITVRIATSVTDGESRVNIDDPIETEL